MDSCWIENIHSIYPTGVMTLLIWELSMFHVPEEYRITDNRLGMGSDKSYGNNGAFNIPVTGKHFFIIASDMNGWEHVSVHVQENNKRRVPRWDEMCKIKDIFWDEEDVVVQYHPRKSEYVNLYPLTLHLWKPINQEFLTPPAYMVGPQIKILDEKEK
jgi:hypothetical protein